MKSYAVRIGGRVVERGSLDVEATGFKAGCFETDVDFGSAGSGIACDEVDGMVAGVRAR